MDPKHPLAELTARNFPSAHDEALAVKPDLRYAGPESSVLLEMGEYRVKIELTQGDQVIGARTIPLSLTQIGRVHQITVKNEWLQ